MKRSQKIKNTTLSILKLINLSKMPMKVARTVISDQKCTIHNLNKKLFKLMTHLDPVSAYQIIPFKISKRWGLEVLARVTLTAFKKTIR